MKTPNKLLPLAFVSSFLFGCSATSVQHVAKPDTNKPIGDKETIIQLKRADYLGSSLNNATVYANDKSIGLLANADELVWKTKANSLECISLEHETTFATVMVEGVKLDDFPISYKCFDTKPKEMMTLSYDFGYPETRLVRPIAFTPVFKQTATFDKEVKVAVNVINSIAPEQRTGQDKKAKLENSVKKMFGTNITSSSDKTIDLELLEFKAGNAASRWVGKSMDGATFVKVKATIKKNDQVIETFITRPVVSSGGVFSAGADEYIFDEVAEDVFLHLFGNKS